MQQYSNNLSAYSIPVIAAVLASLSTFLQSWGTYDKLTDNVATFFDNAGEDFDFIIIGAGSAGGVLAHRLSAEHNVLLLEAGGALNPFQAIPAMSLLMLNYPQIDWKHKTVPQKYACYGLPFNESHWSQGKGLGGTSNLNFLIQSRGNPKDFDNWAKVLNDSQWNYENLLPYFRVSEDYHGPWDSEITHGKGGLLKIAIPEYTGMAEEYVQAAGELGYPRADLNGYYTEGFDTIFYPILAGRRHGVYAAFIDSVLIRQSLIIRKYSYVKRILIDNNKRAYGVEYDHHGRPAVAFAKKEVILSAGAMNSPKILLLSGVGPKEELRRHGIPIKADLPVGENLQDHVSAYLGPFFINRPDKLFDIERDVNVGNIARYLTTGLGVLTTSGTQAMGFFASSEAKKVGEGDWPDIQIIFAGVTMGNRFGEELARGFGPKKELMKQYLAHSEGKNSFLQIVSLGRPHAVGKITLNSKDPYAPARIDPRYFSKPHDIKVMVEAIKTAVDLIEKTKAFKGMKGRFTNVPLPGCEHEKFRSDKYWECYARYLAITLHHIVGSVSMGRDGQGVLDTELRVKGIKGLRVIDASVMPVVPVGNTNAPTIMIAEKGADMILRNWTIVQEPEELPVPPEKEPEPLPEPINEPPTVPTEPEPEPEPTTRAAPETTQAPRTTTTTTTTTSTTTPPPSSTSTQRTRSTTEDEEDEEDYEEEEEGGDNPRRRIRGRRVLDNTNKPTYWFNFTSAQSQRT